MVLFPVSESCSPDLSLLHERQEATLCVVRLSNWESKPGKRTETGLSLFVQKPFFEKQRDRSFLAFFSDLLLSAGVAPHEVFRDAARVRDRELEMMIMHASNSRPGLSSSSEQAARERATEKRERVLTLSFSREKKKKKKLSSLLL